MPLWLQGACTERSYGADGAVSGYFAFIAQTHRTDWEIRMSSEFTAVMHELTLLITAIVALIKAIWPNGIVR
jgi:hypothetical protein